MVAKHTSKGSTKIKKHPLNSSSINFNMQKKKKGIKLYKNKKQKLLNGSLLDIYIMILCVKD